MLSRPLPLTSSARFQQVPPRFGQAFRVVKEIALSIGKLACAGRLTREFLPYLVSRSFYPPYRVDLDSGG